MTIKFDSVDRNVSQDELPAGTKMYFGLISQGLFSEAKLFVSHELSSTIDCGKPLNDLLKSFREAILDSARAHGNPTVWKAK